MPISQFHQGLNTTSHIHRKCPYEYEIKNGRLFIENEDYGAVEDCFAQGEKLHDIVRVMHEVATAA